MIDINKLSDKTIKTIYFVKGLVFVVLGLLAWSIIEIAGSLVYRGGANPLTLLVVRFLIACPLFFATLWLRGKDSLKVKKKDFKSLAFHSGILIFHLVTFWQGIKILAHVPTAVIIYISYPIWIVTIASLFLKERFDWRKIVSLVLGSFGVLFGMKFLPSLSLLNVNLAGGTLMLAAAIFWALYVLAGKSLLKEYDPFTVLFYNFVICLVVFLSLQNPVVIVREVTLNMFGYLMIMGVVSTYLAYLFYYLGLQYLKASDVGIIGFLKPFVTITLAYFILHQPITPLQALGSGLTMMGVYLVSREKYG